jgi:hypothetical protein
MGARQMRGGKGNLHVGVHVGGLCKRTVTATVQTVAKKILARRIRNWRLRSVRRDHLRR